MNHNLRSIMLDFNPILFFQLKGKKIVLLLLLIFMTVNVFGQTTVWSETFESANSLTLVQGSQTNYWVRGTTTKCTGSNSLFVTNNGTANAYTSTTSVSHAYKDLTFPSNANITLTFNWKCNGESTYDYLKVWIVDQTTTPVAGTELTATLLGTYNLDTICGQATINLNAYTGLSKRLVFSWRNDGSVLNDPPASIDDILVTSFTGPCVTPTAMTCGTTYSGTLASTGSDWSTYTGCATAHPGDEIVYTYTPATSENFTFTTTTTSGDPDFFLSNSCGTAGTNLTGGCWLSGNKTVALTAGITYYLIVDNASSSASAGYTVSVSCPTTGPCSTATTMTCGTTYTGTLGTTGGFWSTYTGCTYTEPGSEMVFTYTPTTTGNATFVTTSTTGDPDFFLMSSCGNTGTNIYNACWGSGNITVSLTAGVTYYLIADNYSSSASAGFTVLVNCPPTPPPIQPPCTNLGFENGFTGWYGTAGGSDDGVSGATSPTYVPVLYNNTTTTQTTLMTAGVDPYGGFPTVFNGTYSARIGNASTSDTYSAGSIEQSFLVDSTNTNFSYSYAVVLQDGGSGHDPWVQPYFTIGVYDQSGAEITCGMYLMTAPGAGYVLASGYTDVYYKPWSTVSVNLSSYLGQSVTIKIVASDCAWEAHFGYAYIDCACAPFGIIHPAVTCAGQPATLTAPSGAASYSWSPGGATTQSITVSPGVTTNYTCTMTTSGITPCPVVLTTTVTVFSAASVTATASPASVCSGQSTTISATGGTSYTWSPSGSGSSFIANPLSTTTYSVTASATGGCTASTTVTVTVNSSATITATALPASVCPGSSSTITATGGDTYAWSHSASGSPITVTPLSTTTYTVTGSTTSGCSGTASVTVTVNPLPTLSCPPAFNVAACNGPVPAGATTIAAFTALSGSTNGTSISYTDGTPVLSGCTETTTRTYTATLNGCTQTCTQTLTRTVDITGPSVTGTITAANVTGCTIANKPAAVGTVAALEGMGVAISDNCTPDGSITVASSDGASTGSCPITFTRTYTLTDACGNATTATQSISISGPSLTMPANAGSTVSCPDATDAAPIVPVVADNCGNTLTPTGPVISPKPTGSGTRTYTYTYTDCTGITHNWVYTYTVSASGFVMPAAGASTVACPAATDAVPTPPTLTDICCAVLVPTGPVVTAKPACNGTRTYTWTYTDCTNTSYTWTYTYTVAAPIVTIPAGGSSTVACVANATVPTPPAVNDNCGRALSVSAGAAGTDPACTGTKTWTFTYTDCAGATYPWVYTYTIAAPVVSMPAGGSSTVACVANATLPTPPAVNDNCGRALSVSAGVAGTDPACAGTKTWTFTYTDCAGVTYPWVYTYTISAPIVTIPPAGSSTVACVANATLPTPPTVIDNCGRTLSVSAGIAGANPACAGTKTWTFTYTDCAGATYPWVYTYTIAAPVVTMPSNGASTVACLANATAPTPPTVNDNCGRALSVSAGVAGTNPACAGTKTWTFTYTDCAGVTYPWVYTYTIAAPIVTIPTNGASTVTCQTNATVPVPPSITDNCGRILTASAPTTSVFTGCESTYTYTFVFTDCQGNTYNWLYVYTILNAAPTITSCPAAQSFCTSPTGNYTIPQISATDDCGTVTYSYSITGATNRTGTGNNASGSFTTGASVIAWTVTDACGNISTCSTNVTISPTPTATVPSNITVCTGTLIPAQNLSSTPAGASLPWTNSNASIGLAQNGAGPVIPAFTASNTGTAPVVSTITITPTVSGCTGSPVTYNITVNPLPQITFPAIPAICINAPATTLTGATPAGGVYSGTGVNSGSFNPVASGAGTFLITYTYTDANGCINAATQNITVNSQPTVAITPQNPVICVGNSVSLTATGASTYNWTPTTGLNPSTGNLVSAAPLTTTTYTVTGTENGCTNTATTVVNVYTSIPVSVSPATASICPGDGTTLTATGGATYVWDNASTLSSQTGAVVTATPSTTTVYNVVGSDLSGCTGSASAVVSINPLANIGFIANPKTGCAPLNVDFEFNPGNSIMNHSWLWNFGNNNSTSTDTITNHEYSGSGTYIVTLIAQTIDGCNVSIHDTIRVHPVPEADFIAHPDVMTTDDPTVSFIDASTNTSIWNWNFGDPASDVLNTSELQNPIHSFSVAGEYTVLLAVSNQYGCVDTATKVVTIHDAFAFWIPNAFSPNDDLVNDYFTPQGVGYKENTYLMRILDRWGKILFYSEDLTKGWNGKDYNSGLILPDGVYTYQIKITDQSNHEHEYIGSVILLK